MWEALFNCTNSERSLSILRKIIRVNILWKQWVFHAEINVCAIKCQPIIGRDLYSLRCGDSRSELMPELQIIPQEEFEAAQRIREDRSAHAAEEAEHHVPLRTRGQALL